MKRTSRSSRKAQEAKRSPKPLSPDFDSAREVRGKLTDTSSFLPPCVSQRDPTWLSGLGLSTAQSRSLAGAQVESHLSSLLRKPYAFTRMRSKATPTEDHRLTSPTVQDLSFPSARAKDGAGQDLYSPGGSHRLPSNGQTSMTTLGTTGIRKSERETQGQGTEASVTFGCGSDIMERTSRDDCKDPLLTSQQGQEGQLEAKKPRAPESLSWKAAGRVELVQDQPQPEPPPSH